MDDWEGWDFQRFYVLFVAAAFVLLGLQVFLFHWRAAFSRWTTGSGRPGLAARPNQAAATRSG